MHTQRWRWMGFIILTCVGFSDFESLAQAPLPSPSTGSSVQGSGIAPSVSVQLQALAAQISSLNQDLTAALKQLEQLRASKPKPPSNDATPAVKAAYANALDSWNKQMQAMQQQLQTLQARINALERELAQVASQLSAAQQADIAKQQLALAEAKKKISQAMVLAASLKPPPVKSAIGSAGGGAGVPAPSGLP